MMEFPYEVVVANHHRMLEVIQWLRDQKMVHMYVCPINATSNPTRGFRNGGRAQGRGDLGQYEGLVKRVIKLTSGDDAMLFKLVWG
jgi:hypothetical protein